jgi:hypothetical protein
MTSLDTQSTPGTPGTGSHSAEMDTQLFRLVRMQFYASIVIGILIVGAVLWLGSDIETRGETLKTLKDWGGIVMGFFFGSMFTQTQALIESFRKK